FVVHGRLDAAGRIQFFEHLLPFRLAGRTDADPGFGVLVRAVAGRFIVSLAGRRIAGRFVCGAILVRGGGGRALDGNVVLVRFRVLVDGYVVNVGADRGHGSA